MSFPIRPPKFALSAKIKDVFFDRAGVIAKIGAANAKALNRVGGALRLTARRKLRRRKKASQPGQPPSVHSQDDFATLKNILYGLQGQSSVLIGPRALNQSRGTIPGLHEFSGQQKIAEQFVPYSYGDAMRRYGIRGHEIVRASGIVARTRIIETRGRKQAQAMESEDRRGVWVPRGRRKFRPGADVRERIAKYPKRPYMKPSLDDYMPRIPEQFRAIIGVQ
jgi:hypothetical protein